MHDTSPWIAPIELAVFAVIAAVVVFFTRRKNRQLKPWLALVDELGWERVGTHRLEFTAPERDGRVIGALSAHSGREGARERFFWRDPFVVTATPARGPGGGLARNPDDPAALAVLNEPTRRALDAARADGVRITEDGALSLDLGRHADDDTADRIRRLIDLADRLNVPEDLPGSLLELAATDPDADHAQRCALAVMRHHGDDARVIAFAQTHRDADDVALRVSAGLVLEDVEVIREGVAHDAAPAWLRAACGAWLAARFGAEGGGRLATVAPEHGALSVASARQVESDA